MKKLLLYVIFLCFFSCNQQKENPYVGNWYFDGTVDISKSNSFNSATMGNHYTFTIRNDSVLDYKAGFFHNTPYNYYLGTETKYTIKNTSIHYFNKSENEWDTITVKKIHGDTMVVVGYENTLYRLVKKKNTYFDTEKYDAIIVDRSPCYGSCPFNSTYIDRKGNFCFKGYEYNTQKGTFFSKFDEETTKQFFNDFDKIDIFELKDNYIINATDSQTNVISFIKDGKIVKTISSYIACPVDLQKAYMRLSYAYQQVKLNYDYNKEFIFDSKVSFGRFKTKRYEFRLFESESFFLENEIRKGTKIQHNFTEKYELDFYEFQFKENEETEIKKIVTDGRYYRFIKNDNSFFVIDIGYNFIDRNPIIKKNRNH